MILFVDFCGLITGMNPASSLLGIISPPLHGIVQLANSDALRFQNWSFWMLLNEPPPITSRNVFG
jgi:hypothetical protein